MDIEVNHHGSIVTLEPLTAAGRAWIDENLATEGWQWLGGAVGIEPRCVPAIVDGMRADGLEVE